MCCSSVRVFIFCLISNGVLSQKSNNVRVAVCRFKSCFNLNISRFVSVYKFLSFVQVILKLCLLPSID